MPAVRQDLVKRETGAGGLTAAFSLAGRRALITGATGGIGAATARLFAEAGADLLLSSEDHHACSALATALRAGGSVAHALVADLADRDAVGQLAAEAADLAGSVDILICNAGIEGPVGPAHSAPNDAIDRLFAINLRAALTLTGAIAPAMAAHGHGSIVLVASIAGLRGNKSIGSYALTKAALIQHARNLAVEWGPHGVRANAVAPGLIDTPFARPILDDQLYLERRLSLTPLRRAGTAAEIASAILFLASDAGGFVTGQTLVADGGTLISDGN